jgi:hypothetical protein
MHRTANRTEREREEQQRGTRTPHLRGRSSRATEGAPLPSVSCPMGLSLSRSIPHLSRSIPALSRSIPPLSSSIPPLSRSIPPLSRANFLYFPPIPSQKSRQLPWASDPTTSDDAQASRAWPSFPRRAPNSKFLGIPPSRPLQRDPTTRLHTQEPEPQHLSGFLPCGRKHKLDYY